MVGLTVAQALRTAAGRLAAVSDTARLDAELLMAQALGVARSALLLGQLDAAAPAGFAALVDRRARHEPVAYILGRQEFYGLDLEVSPAVLIPRADSETLIEAARAVFAGRPAPRRILDLGTGSGALLLAALSLWPEALGWGIDRDPHACAVALRNAARVGANGPPSADGLGRMRAGPAGAGNGLSGGGGGDDTGRARFLRRDWTQPGWRDDLGRFDLVLANPPYVETTADLARSVRAYEPAGALFAGPDGLDDHRALLPQLPPLLEAGGRAVLEIGAGQAAAVRALARAAGFATQTVPDLAGRPRALVLAL